MSLIVVAFGCTPYPDEPVAGVDRSHPLIEQIGYTAVRVSDNGEVSRSKKDVDRIGFGTVRGTSYTERVTREPVWQPKDGSWMMLFDETFTIPDDVAYTTVRIRTYLTDGRRTDEDHVIPTNRYPYKENEIIVTGSILTYGFASGGWFQDVAATHQHLYALTLGPTTIWQTDLKTKVSEQVLVTGAGDNITSDGDEIFIDAGHDRIYRWGKVKDDVGQLIWHGQVNDVSIVGMAAEEGMLYTIVRDRTTSETRLLTMDYDGQVLNDRVLAFSSEYYAAVREGILYLVHNTGYDEDAFLLYRYDIAGGSMLNPVLAPARWLAGIEIVDSYLYYVDDLRNIIGRVRYDQLIEVIAPSVRTTRADEPASRQRALRPDDEIEPSVPARAVQ